MATDSVIVGDGKVGGCEGGAAAAASGEEGGTSKGRLSADGGTFKHQNQGVERCPQCGITCRNSSFLQMHLEDVHKLSYSCIDKSELGAQFSQVVSSIIL